MEVQPIILIVDADYSFLLKKGKKNPNNQNPTTAPLTKL